MNTYFHNFFIDLNDDSEKALSELTKLINSYDMKLDAISNYAEGDPDEIYQVTVFRYSVKADSYFMALEFETRSKSIIGYYELHSMTDFTRGCFSFDEGPQISENEEDHLLFVRNMV